MAGDNQEREGVPGSDSSALTTRKEGLPSDFFGMKDLQQRDDDADDVDDEDAVTTGSSNS